MASRARRGWLPGLALGALLVQGWGGAAETPSENTGRAGGKATIKSVKYADLARAVTAQRGKVVVVEIWGEF